MKIKNLSFLFLLSIVFFCSCSKDNATPSAPIVTHDTVVSIIRDTIVSIPPNAIVGLWIGSQIAGDGSTTTPLYYSFEIKSDGTLLVQGSGADGNTYYSIGTWTLNGTAFTALITVSNFSQAGVKQNIAAVYDKTVGKLKSGTIQTIGVGYTGTFILDRVN
jgi:hypothetical protein